MQLPITGSSIKDDLIANINTKTTSTVKNITLTDGIINVENTEQPDQSLSAMEIAIANTIFNCLYAILQSNSINVSGVLDNSKPAS